MSGLPVSANTPEPIYLNDTGLFLFDGRMGVSSSGNLCGNTTQIDGWMDGHGNSTHVHTRARSHTTRKPHKGFWVQISRDLTLKDRLSILHLPPWKLVWESQFVKGLPIHHRCSECIINLDVANYLLSDLQSFCFN